MKYHLNCHVIHIYLHMASVVHDVELFNMHIVILYYSPTYSIAKFQMIDFEDFHTHLKKKRLVHV